jgi:hypothetical protein
MGVAKSRPQSEILQCAALRRVCSIVNYAYLITKIERTSIMKLPSDLYGDMNGLIKMKAQRENELAGKFDAEHVYVHILQRLKDLQDSLEENEEVGVRLANFGAASELHIRSLGYQNPNLIEFSALDPDGNRVVLLQHISQLNFILVALRPIKETPYRIGF